MVEDGLVRDEEEDGLVKDEEEDGLVREEEEDGLVRNEEENGWMKDEEEQDYVVLYLYQEEERAIFLPGDHITRLYCTQDWFYVKRPKDGVCANIPAAYTSPVPEKDDICINVKITLEETLQKFKTFYLNARKSERFKYKEFMDSWGKLVNLYCCRNALKHKLSTDDLKQLCSDLVSAINGLPAVDEDRMLMDGNLCKIYTKGLHFSEVCKLYMNEEKDSKFRLSTEEIKTTKFYSLGFRKSDVRIQFDDGRIDTQLALYEPGQGFITEFFVYSDMMVKERVKEFGRKKIIFSNDRNMDNTSIVILIVLNEPTTQARRCVAVGTQKVNQLKLKEGQIDISIYPMKEQPISLREQIKKHMDTKHMKVNSKMTFSCKLVEQGMIKHDDYVFQNLMPVTVGTKVNQLFLTLNRVKLKENFNMFGDNNDLGIEAYVAMEDGTLQPILDISGERTGNYESLSTYGNVAEWRETFVIKLNESWRNQHVLFKIYKYDEKKGKKMFAFSFLQLLSRSSQTIVKDNTYKLMVYMTINDYVPNTDDYVKDELPCILDLDVKKRAIQKFNRRNKFTAQRYDYLEIGTCLKSAVLTEDSNIFQFLDMDSQQVTTDQLRTILADFVTFKRQDSVKKILFVTQILDALWRILDDNPAECESIFYCFFETIYLTSEQKGIKERLWDYLNNTFDNKNVFRHFIASFIKLITGNTDEPKANDAFVEIFQSFSLFLQFLEKSYRINKRDEPQFDGAEDMGNLVHRIETFMECETIESKKVTFYKELCKSSNLDLLVEMLSPDETNSFISKLVSFDVSQKLRLGACTNILKSKVARNQFFWESMYKAILSQLQHGFKHAKDANLAERLICVLTQLLELTYQYEPKFRDEMVREFILKMVDIITAKQRLTAEATALVDSCKLVFIYMLEDITQQTVEVLISTEKNCLAILSVIRGCLQKQPLVQKFLILRLRWLKIILHFIQKANKLMISKPFSLTVQHEYVLTLLKVMQEEDFMEERQNSKEDQETTANIRDAIIALLEEFFRSLDVMGKKRLAFHDRSGLVINNIFETSVIKNAAVQDSMIRLMFEFIMAEYITTNYQGVDEVYSWFINRIMKMYTSRTLAVDQADVDTGYKNKLTRIMETMVRTQTNCNLEADKRNSVLLCNKVTTMLSHIDLLFDCVIDSVEIQRYYRDKSDGVDFYYFAHVEAEYNVYKTLRRIEKEAGESGLIGTNILPYWLKEYKQILKVLYDIFLEKEEIVCCGFTLQEFETLVPWSSDTMDEFREFKMVVGAWWKDELERDNQLKHVLAKSNKKVEKLLDRTNPLDTSFPEATEWQKVDLTWSEFKEILQKLVIVKFEEAAGFECSQNLMDDLIHRYRTVDINFKKLASVYHNLADIFATQADFKQKMLTTSQGDRQKLENARRDIMEPEYFKIEFMNAPCPFKFLHKKKFIYRERAMKKAGDLNEKLTAWFPDAQIIQSKQALRKSLIGGDNSSYTLIFVQKVNPVITNMEDYEKLEIPLQVLKYKTTNVSNAYAFKEQIDKQGSVRVNLSLCEFELPGMLRWSQVLTDELETTARPVVSYLTNIQAKNLELQGYLESLQEDPESVNMTTISMCIQGVILASVNGGIAELQSKFINDEYRDEHPEDSVYVEHLINEIKKQNIYVEGLLKIHGEENKFLEDLQREMEKEFSKRKPMVDKLYGTSVDKTFKIPILDKMTIENAKQTLNQEFLVCL